MVKYINLDKPNTSFKKYIVLGAAIAAIAGVGLEYNNNKDYWKPRVDTVLCINSKESLEYRINNFKKDLREHPEYTDKLISTGIKAMNDGGYKFSAESYFEMFGAMKNKFEEKPELLDYLGPNAMKYQESSLIRKCKNGIDDIYQNLKQKAIEAKDKLKEKFSD